jgi:aspartyl/asparaginyl-tRNA synthetase
MIDSIEFDKCVSCMRTFFKVKGFVEVHPQSRLSILACEDPQTITTFQYANQLWPLPQTSQMWLEYEMLKDPERAPGYFCVSTSYRNEPTPVEGHEIIFPMFEFELKGGLDKLIELERELLEFIGFKSKENDAKYPEETYRKVAERYGVVELEHETQMGVDYGDVFFLKHFPNYTSPFWNMKQKYDEVEKVDVIIHGIKTIGSAERSTDPVDMRNMFKTIRGGQYADILYNTFGQQRVDDELELFLNNTFVQRSGGGIDINQMIRAMKLSNLM